MCNQDRQGMNVRVRSHVFYCVCSDQLVAISLGKLLWGSMKELSTGQIYRQLSGLLPSLLLKLNHVPAAVDYLQASYPMSFQELTCVYLPHYSSRARITDDQTHICHFM